MRITTTGRSSSCSTTARPRPASGRARPAPSTAEPSSAGYCWASARAAVHRAAGRSLCARGDLRLGLGWEGGAVASGALTARPARGGRPSASGPCRRSPSWRTSATARAGRARHGPPAPGQARPDVGPGRRSGCARTRPSASPGTAVVGHDGGAVALEGQRRHQPDAVDLGHRVCSVTPARRASASRSWRSAVPCGGSTSGCSARSARVTSVRSASGLSPRGQEHQLLLEERGGVDLRVVDRQVDDGQVELAGHQLGDEGGGAGLEDDQLDPRVGGLHRGRAAGAPASGRWCR